MRRFDAYSSALSILRQAYKQDLSNEFIQSGIVDKFSLQFELGWKMLKDLLRYEGIAEATTGFPRTILKSAYRYFDFIDEQTWLHMLQDRNAIAHVYDGEALTRLLDAILKSYIPAFLKLADDVADRYGSELERIP